MQARVFKEAAEVREVLARIELTPEILSRAVNEGQRALDAADGDLPSFLRRLFAFGWTIASLVKQLGPGGWTLEEWKNWPRVVNRDRTVAIAVAAGDGMTGIDGPEDPKTSCPKGPMSDLAVLANQMALDLEPASEQIPHPEPEELQTHFLLYYTRDGQTRCELSLPMNKDETDRLCGWGQRIIVGNVGDGPHPFLRDVPEPTPEINIDVRRRAR